MAATALSTLKEHMTKPSASAALHAPEGGLSDDEREPCKGSGLVALADEKLHIICPACGLGFGVLTNGEQPIPRHLPPLGSKDGR